MAKVSSPLYGMSADGQIGKSLVYARWKGVRYARRYTVGANPKTVEQEKTRGTFKWLADLYRFAPALFRDPWIARVKGEPMTPVNMFIKQNLSFLRGQSDIVQLAVSTPVAGGMAPVSGSVTGGAGTVTVALDAPTLPTGWAVKHMVACVISDQVPSGAFSGTFAVNYGNTAPYSVQFTGLTPGDYLGAGYFVYDRDDGTLAYGAPYGEIVAVS